MLFQATLLVDLTAMAICLWLAFYLFARGFPNPLTMRGVILLLALSAFFYGAYNNLFEQVTGTAALRASCLITGISAWYSITLQLLSEKIRKSLQWWTSAVYILAAVTIALLISTRNAFVGEQGNVLYVARMGVGLPYILYGIFEIVALGGILYNLLAFNRVGFTTEGKFFLGASLFAVAGVAYGIVALALTAHTMPRIIQDSLIFCGVFMIGYSAARYQTLVERRTTLQDFPITTLTILFFATAVGYSAYRLGFPLQWLGALIAFVVLTLAFYDLVREFLERLRIRKESTFRKQLRRLENERSAEDALKVRLQTGLDLLCQALNTSGGLIAVRSEDEFIITATKNSVPLESRFSSDLFSYEDISEVTENDLVWVAPTFDGQTQIAIVGIAKPKKKLEYSTGELDLLSEFADQIGTVISLSNLRPQQTKQIRELVAETQANVNELDSVANEMISAIAKTPDEDFIKILEEGLRHLPDTITLGQSTLAEKISVQGESHIERGKNLQQLLMNSIELLRPAEKRPAEPLPRVWYNHAVLYDAYVEGVPNREIMARLYISEGTFNRTRRNAIRGLARLLVEQHPTSL
jgi:GAF domain-containing protein